MTQNADPHVQQTTNSSSQIIQDNECWGRLMPTLPGPQACGYDFMIDQQVYTLGRSLDCDIVATEPPKDHARAQWAYAMISNQHCRVYYGKDRTGSHRECAFLQDCSGNGTMINRRLLRKGESRRLHSGDEICLVNPDTLRKKVRSQTALAELTSRYSYVFAETHVRADVFCELFSVKSCSFHKSHSLFLMYLFLSYLSANSNDSTRIAVDGNTDTKP